MGLYSDVSTLTATSQATRTDTGTAYLTLGTLLEGARADTASTASLALPANVSGGAFVTADGHEAYALWATDTADESATASYALASANGVDAYTWDLASSHSIQTILPMTGHVTLPLTASVQIFIQK